MSIATADNFKPTNPKPFSEWDLYPIGDGTYRHWASTSEVISYFSGPNMSPSWAKYKFFWIAGVYNFYTGTEFMPIGAPGNIKGIATPTTTPQAGATPTSQYIYFAGPGTFANFPGTDGNPIVLTENLNIISWDGTQATQQAVPVNVDTSSLVAKSELGRTPVGKNRFDVSLIVVGAITSAGTLNTGYPNARSIIGQPVTGGEYVTLSGIIGATNNYFIALKDKNNALVGTVQDMEDFPKTLLVPDGAVTADYTILGSNGVGDYSEAQFERSLSATDYEAPILGVNEIEDPIAAKYITGDADIQDPITKTNPTNKRYVDDNAINFDALNKDFSISNAINTAWSWKQTSNSEFIVSGIVGTWDAVGFNEINNLQFTIQHGRLWALLGYKDANNICALGLTSPGAVNTFFGQIVNIDLSAQTFTVIRPGTIASKPIGTKIKIVINGSNLSLYANGQLGIQIDLSTYPTANLQNMLLGLSGFNSSSSIPNNTILASDVYYTKKSTVKEELTKITTSPSRKYDSLKEKKISIIGDSISTGNPIYGGVTTANCWWGLLKSWTGIETYVNAIGGTAIAYSSANESFVTDSRWQSLNSQFEPEAIIVFGGTNDFGARAIPIGDPTDVASATNPTFYSGVKYLFQNLCARYPTAKIFCMTPLHQSGYGFPETAGGRLFSDYIGVLKELAPLYGINIIDTYSKSGLTYENMKSSLGIYTDDDLHPNAAGHYKFAEVVGNELNEAFR